MTFLKVDQIKIGTQYKLTGKRQVAGVWTVRDIWKTYDSKGELVKVRCVCTSPCAFNVLTDYDVVAVTIQKNHIAGT